MKLFHTSQVVIEKPDVHHGRKNADFGQGFYLSPDEEFVYRWAVKDAYINEYELNTEGLKIVSFSRSAEWFDYIFQNRRTNDTIEADVIIGPIANDTIYDTFGIISSGFLRPEEALELLMVGPEYIQVAIKTQKAADQLNWLRATKIENADNMRNILKKEQDDYQKAFADSMKKIEDRE
ncbi:MAG: DUF3990 domain-containing protein [Butyrivibrio sp.]|nr:DUF3990 domain-containing protein [Butyrivibrio sp.]